ncbi:MAG: aldo/keto reductase [Pirellulaceae bacterium]|jgi:aryl-alcohol dehydrogenase-like predicted oxidoreductase|nr:aldo/keto reductase [Thermoguttaceae bacterium]NLY98916.1 aldo/keto reductase [Pirellulaceae bacterium]
MQYTTLPGTDLAVSRIAMGCWALAGDMTWGPQDEAAGIAAIHAALDAGINFFDTAEAYGNGISEQMLGKALAGARDRAIVASKFNLDHSAAEQVAAACHRSLERLNADRIDLYQIHWPSRQTPREETWRALERLRDQGKIGYLAVSNFGVGDLEDLLVLGRPVSNQLPYSLLLRAIEFAILPQCIAEEIGVLCYSPLQHGLLTGKFRTADEVPAGRARSRHFSSRRPLTRHGQPGCEAETFAAIDRLCEIAAGLGRSAADVALAWLLAQRGVSSVIVGIRGPEQAQRNAAAAELHLDEATLAALTEATDPVKRILGENPDLWESDEHSRFR